MAATSVAPAMQPGAPRLGIAFPGDCQDPMVWSGTPAGLTRALREIGIDVVPLRADASARLAATATTALAPFYLHRARTMHIREAIRRARSAANTAGPGRSVIRSVAAARSLRRAGQLDAVLQIGTAYRLDCDIPIITLEDMTTHQAIRHGYGPWRILSPAAQRRRQALHDAAYETASFCCSLTAWAARSLVDEYGVPADKVAPLGIGVNHIASDADRDWSRPRFLFVGVEWAHKNGPAVLDAFAELQRRQPEAMLDIVGGHPDINRTGVRTHGLLPRDNKPAQRKLSDLFARSTCLVMPSRSEGAGIVYAEALTAGIPVIGTTVGGAPDVIGDAGILVDPDDPDALLAAMLDVSSPATAKALGEKARARSPEFTWSRVTYRLMGILAGISPAFESFLDCAEALAIGDGPID